MFHPLSRTLVVLATVLLSPLASAQLTLPAAVSLDQGQAFYPAANVIGTSGMFIGGDGLTVDDRFVSEASALNAFVTDAFLPSYFDDGGVAPVLTFTFAAPTDLDGMVVWNYPNTAAVGNAAREGTVELDTGSGFGPPIPVTLKTGSSASAFLAPTRVSLGLHAGVVAARLTIAANYRGFGGAPGGDRVGLGTVAFGLLPPAAPSPNLVPDTNSMDFFPDDLEAYPGNPVLEGGDVTDSPSEGIADPFLFKDGNDWYLFAEIIQEGTGHGDLSVATSEDGLHWQYEQIVLDEPFHLSYPQVFQVDGTYYMIPETHQDQSIRLYRATNFPYDWTLESVLLTGRPFVDASILHYEGRWWIFAAEPPNTHTFLYSSDSLTSGWVEHPQSPVIANDANIARPGGRSFSFAGGTRAIRTAQDDFPFYGEAVRLFEIMELSPTHYAEVELPTSPILTPEGSGWAGGGYHHFDPWPNGDHWLAVIDGQLPGQGGWSIGMTIARSPDAPDGEIDTPASSLSIQAGETVLFSGTATDPQGDAIDSHVWHFGAGAGIADAHLPDPGSVRFTAPGSFEAEYAVWDEHGHADPMPARRTVHVAHHFASILSITATNSNTDPAFALGQIIQGQGAGFANDAPHPALSDLSWSTQTVGAGNDYFAVNPAPVVMDFLLDDVHMVDGIALWANFFAPGNSLRSFEAQFSTTGSAAGLGAPIALAASDLESATMEKVPVPPTEANYVRLTLTDNQAGFALPGGDRLGLREIAFTVDVGPALVVACANGLDDDGDGLIDAGNDPGCRDADFPYEAPACDDGLDNEGDGLVDLDDAECDAAWRHRETPKAACGLGFEAALLLPLLGAWRSQATRGRAGRR